jgi:excisionase family DNA binding protein
VTEHAEKYSTARELADVIGVRVETVYDMAQTGEIPVAFRVGGRLRFDIPHVIRVLEQREKATP